MNMPWAAKSLIGFADGFAFLITVSSSIDYIVLLGNEDAVKATVTNDSFLEN